jgi:transcription termination factor NusB
MTQTKVTLAQDSTGNVETNIDQNAMYVVDFSRITSVNDLVLIFAAMGITFHAQHPMFEVVKDFVDLTNPIYPNQQQQPQPQKTEMKLPKLKKVD